MRTLFTAIAMLVSVLGAPAVRGQAPTRIWLSDSSTVPGDPDAPTAISVALNGVQDLHVWAQSPLTPPGMTLRNFSLNVITTGKIDLMDGADNITVNAGLFEYTYDSMPDGPGCDPVNPVAPCAPPLMSAHEASAEDTLPGPDQILGISGVTISPSSGVPGVSGTQRIASIRYRSLEVGQTNIHLQIGSNGMNHQDIQGVVIPSSMTDVRFGSGPIYNALSDRGINGGTADAVITISAPQPIPGDYDGNGIVQSADYEVWKTSFGNAVTPFTSADGNGNSVVDAGDYTIWRDNLSVPSAGAVSTPESSTAVLLTLGGLLLPACRCRA